MAYLILIVLIAGFIALGFAALPHLHSLPRWFGVGTILWALGWFVFHCGGDSWSRGMLAFVLLAIFIMAWSRRVQWQAAPDWTSDATPRNGFDYFFLSLLALAGVLAVVQTITFPMYMWDSIVMYGFKAKILFYAGTFKTPAFLDPSVLHINANYPLLIPYLEGSFYTLFGATDDRLVKWIFVAFWLAWMRLLYEALRSKMNRTPALGWTCLFASCPFFFDEFMGQIGAGFADMPFAFYWTAFLLAALRWRKSQKTDDLLEAIVFAAGGAFTKNEGLALLVPAGLALLVTTRGKARLSVLTGAAMTAILLGPWFFVRREFQANSAHYAHWPPHLWTHLRDVTPMIAGEFGKELLRVNGWGIFWLMIAAGVLIPGTKRDKDSRFLFAVVAIQAALYFWVYVIYKNSLALLLPITMLRLMIHMAGPLLIASAWRLAPDAE